MTKRTPKPWKTSLPATSLDNHVFETLTHLFDKFVDQIRAGHSHSFLRRLLRKLVRDGDMPLRRVIELTGDKNAALDADAALRDMAEEIHQQREQMPELLQSYLICHPRPSRGRGRRDSDHFLRDQCIAFSVGWARERWSTVIPLTRNDDTEAPSICSYVSLVCRDRGVSIGEKRVKQVYDRFVEFMPRHQSWLMLTKPAI